MANLASYFVYAMTNIEPDDAAANAKAAHAEVSDLLKGSEPLVNLGIKPKLIAARRPRTQV